VDQPVRLLMVGGHVQCCDDPVGGDFGELQSDRSIEAVAEILPEFGWLLCCDRATLDGNRRLPDGIQGYPAPLHSKQRAVAGRASRRAGPI